MNRFINRVAEIVLSEHGVPTEVEGSTQVEVLGHTHTVIAWHVGTHEFCFTTAWVITLSGKSEYITKCLISKTCHELYIVVASIINVTI